MSSTLIDTNKTYVKTVTLPTIFPFNGYNGFGTINYTSESFTNTATYSSNSMLTLIRNTIANDTILKLTSSDNISFKIVKITPDVRARWTFYNINRLFQYIITKVGDGFAIVESSGDIEPRLGGGSNSLIPTLNYDESIGLNFQLDTVTYDNDFTFTAGALDKVNFTISVTVDFYYKCPSTQNFSSQDANLKSACINAWTDYCNKPARYTDKSFENNGLCYNVVEANNKDFLTLSNNSTLLYNSYKTYCDNSGTSTEDCSCFLSNTSKDTSNKTWSQYSTFLTSAGAFSVLPQCYFTPCSNNIYSTVYQVNNGGACRFNTINICVNDVSTEDTNLTESQVNQFCQINNGGETDTGGTTTLSGLNIPLIAGIGGGILGLVVIVIIVIFIIKSRK
jgi:hypothetical protein